MDTMLTASPLSPIRYNNMKRYPYYYVKLMERIGTLEQEVLAVKQMV